jgi:hypothetical protein
MGSKLEGRGRGVRGGHLFPVSLYSGGKWRGGYMGCGGGEGSGIGWEEAGSAQSMILVLIFHLFIFISFLFGCCLRS